MPPFTLPCHLSVAVSSTSTLSHSMTWPSSHAPYHPATEDQRPRYYERVVRHRSGRGHTTWTKDYCVRCVCMVALTMIAARQSKLLGRLNVELWYCHMLMQFQPGWKEETIIILSTDQPKTPLRKL